MSEQLLTVRQVAGRLAVHERTFRRYRPKLIARGLVEIRLAAGTTPRYTESSLDRIISKAADTGVLVGREKRAI